MYINCGETTAVHILLPAYFCSLFYFRGSVAFKIRSLVKIENIMFPIVLVMNPLPISYLSEYAYCPRSAYYLFIDAPKLRDENVFIQSGRHAHQKVDAGYIHSKSAKKVQSSFRLFSDRLNIIGKADIVEFYHDGKIIPIELKRGKKRANIMHQIQLALMALCLKEMFPPAKIDQGAIFFTEDRQKQTVLFTQELLEEAEMIAKTVVEKAKKRLIPTDFPMQKDTRCQGCCFFDLCYL